MLLFVDQLTNVDFSFLDAERGLVGETWLASIALDGALDEQGMVCDFGIIKKRCRQWFDDEIDHKLVVPATSANLQYEILADSNIRLVRSYGKHQLKMTAPLAAVVLIDCNVVTEETVISWSKSQLRKLFPDNLEQLDLSFSTEIINGAYYHYSHGLKQHNGNCQRIAHGHRSRIEIAIDNKRSTDLELKWSQIFKDIYIGNIQDCDDTEADDLTFQYTAPQGYFSLTLPSTCCHLIPTETTVEWIAHYLAETIKHDHPNQRVSVKAYEGINKGAVVTLS